MVFKYKAAICAGTFDRLHQGHKTFLRFAFSVAEKVYVTVTSDLYTATHKPFVSSYGDRLEAVTRFLKEERLLERAILVPINDIYGISLDASLPIEALVVTEDTLRGAKAVNKKRSAYGLPPLAIELTPMEKGETGMQISSSQLRMGMFDAKGNLNIKNDFLYTTLFLPETLRERLQKPFGRIINPLQVRDSEDATKIIAVGDVTTHILHEAGIQQQLSLIDFVVERHKKEVSLQELGFDGTEIVLHAENPAATVTPSLWQTLQKSFSLVREGKKIVVIIHGEEDLTVLPLLLLAPESFSICYGQPHEGMVIVPVNQQTKKEAMILLSEFIRDTTRGH